ncbi:transposase [Rufibacter immobilis]|uniref:transposase n=1 Tax=Rufibacter immobilis TaxID=1348778 RepID=UPI0035E79B9C
MCSLLCVEAGMVSGHTQVVDSALVKANASMDSLELKVPRETLEAHLGRVRAISRADRKAAVNKASLEQQTITASSDELLEIKARNRNWSLKQDLRPGARNKNSKYTSNKTHYSPVDPDARIAVKPGKARRLCYLAQLSVDSAHHTITHAQADFADRKDNQCLPRLLEGLTHRLRQVNLGCSSLLADAGYSSGENYALLEGRGIRAFIPPHGTYKGGPEGFTYDREEDCWLCPQGKKATFRKVKVEPKNNIRKKVYLTTRKDCRGCPLREGCIGKGHERKVEITYYREEYERVIARLESRYGRRMKGMLLAAAAYNLKKLLRFTPKRRQSAVMALPGPSAAASLGFFGLEDRGEIKKRTEASKEALLYSRVVQQLPMLCTVVFLLLVIYFPITVSCKFY